MPVELLIAMRLGDKTLNDRLRECQIENLPGVPLPELLGYMEDAAKAASTIWPPIGPRVRAATRCS